MKYYNCCSTFSGSAIVTVSADQPMFVVVHFYGNTEVQSIISEILCVGGWVVIERRLRQKLEVAIAATSNSLIITMCEPWPSP